MIYWNTVKTRNYLLLATADPEGCWWSRRTEMEHESKRTEQSLQVWKF